MNKKMAIISMLALLILFSAAPAMAEPTQGQMVPVTSIFVPPPEQILGEGKMTNGGIFTYKGMVEVYRNNLLVIGGDPPLTICAYLVGSGCWNTKTEVMKIHWDAVWYISTEGSPNGFSGNEELTLFGYDPVTHLWDSMTLHCVLHGFGAYAGQTLMLSYKGPISAVTTGYCLKG
jgi:hypothetical protein